MKKIKPFRSFLPAGAVAINDWYRVKALAGHRQPGIQPHFVKSARRAIVAAHQ